MSFVHLNPLNSIENNEVIPFPVELDGKTYLSLQSYSFSTMIVSLMATHSEIPRRGEFRVFLDNIEIEDIHQEVDPTKLYRITSENFIINLPDIGRDIISMFSDRNYIYVFYEEGSVNVLSKINYTLARYHSLPRGIQSVVYNDTQTKCLITGSFKGIILLNLSDFSYEILFQDVEFSYAAFCNCDHFIVASYSKKFKIFDISTKACIYKGCGSNISTNFSSDFLIFSNGHQEIWKLNFIDLDPVFIGETLDRIREMHILEGDIHVSTLGDDYNVSLRTKTMSIAGQASEISLEMKETLILYYGDRIEFNDEEYHETDIKDLFHGKDEFFSLHEDGSVKIWKI